MALKQINKHTNFKIRLGFVNAHIIGKLNYILPLYTQANKLMINKLHKVIMTAARCVIGNYCLRKSTIYILEKCGWLNINKMISNASLKFINNIIISKAPKAIYDLFKINRRSVVNINLRYIPKSKYHENAFLCKELKNYNNLPKTLKGLTNLKFKKSIKEYLKATTGTDTRD